MTEVTEAAGSVDEREWEGGGAAEAKPDPEPDEDAAEDDATDDCASETVCVISGEAGSRTVPFSRGSD